MTIWTRKANNSCPAKTNIYTLKNEIDGAQLQDEQQTNNKSQFTIYKQQLKNITNSYLGANYSGLEGITPEDIAININSSNYRR